MSSLSDEELIRRVQGGDAEAFGRLVSRYERLVFGVSLHCLGNVEDARDVAQDVFIRAFNHIGQVRDGSRFGAWVRQVTVNECRSFSRRRTALPLDVDIVEGYDAFAQSDQRIWLSSGLDRLDEPSRLALILFYLHSYSMIQIGQFLEEPVTTIKSRLRNARSKLRNVMDENLKSNLQRPPLPADFADQVVAMIESVQAGDEATTRRLLLEDPRLAGVAEEPGLQTPLHIAAASGHGALVELLLAHGANPDALDRGDNAAPIHYACERGRLECVRLLVEAGADIDSEYNVHQRSPLGWACVFGTVQREVADYLISRGATVDIFSAIALERAEEIRSMVGANPFLLGQRMSQCELFLSPIEFACSLRNFEIGKLLVELGSELTLSEAAGLGLADVVRSRLLESPSQFVVSKALRTAVRAGQLGTARLLLEQGGEPNFAPQGTSLIFSSIEANDEPMSRLLLEFGADLEFRDPQWNSTALGWQVFYGNPESTALALALGASIAPNLVDLAEAGARGELRRWSSGTPDGYAKVRALL